MSGEFWAAIAGAIVGGIISAFLQLITARASNKAAKSLVREAQIGICRALLFKVIKIESDFVVFSRHADEAEENAARNELKFGWATFIPIATLPRPVIFTPEEMGGLIRLKDEDLFNDILALDEVHDGAVELLRLYRQERMALTNILPAEMQGTRGTSDLSREQYLVFAPKMAQLEQLTMDIADLFRAETRQPLGMSKRLVIAMNKAFSLQLKIEPRSQPAKIEMSSSREPNTVNQA